MKQQSDLNLKPFNTLGIGSTAVNAFFIESEKDLLSLAQTTNISNALVLGGGSNIILGKELLSRPVLINQIKGVRRVNDDEKTIDVAAGENWDEFVDWTLDNELYGLENLALIPGTVGASPIQNIGAYGVEVQRFITHVRYFDLIDHQIYTLTHQQCEFNYRDSIFKHQLNGRAFIVSVSFSFSKPSQTHIDSPGLAEEIARIDSKQNEKPSAKVIAKAIRQLRLTKLPDPKVIHNVGSFFKNPVMSLETYQHLKASYSNMPAFYLPNNRIKTSAAWLIEQCGWKGYTDTSGAGVADKHALVLVNNGCANGDDILALAEKIKQSVVTKFSIHLSIEPIIIH